MFADAKIIPTGQNNYQVSYGSDQGLWVEFEMKPVHLAFMSEKEGRPVYEERPFIKITVPGAPPRVIEREVTEEDKQRFSRQYAAFTEQGKAPSMGTPVEEWPILSKAQAMSFKASKIHTVEQIASLSDDGLTALGLGGRELRQKAQVFLDRAKEGAAANAAIEENKVLRADIDALREQLKELSKQLEKKNKGDK